MISSYKKIKFMLKLQKQTILQPDLQRNSLIIADQILAKILRKCFCKKSGQENVFAETWSKKNFLQKNKS